MKKIISSCLGLGLFLSTFTVQVATAQVLTTATIKDPISGESYSCLLLKATPEETSRLMEKLKIGDPDFENLRGATHWESTTIPTIVGAVELDVEQGYWTSKEKSLKFTLSDKPRNLKEGETAGLRIRAIDSEGNNISDDADKRDSLSEYFEKLLKE